MSNNKPNSSMIYNIAILSFLDKPVDHIIQAYIQKYPDQVDNHDTSPWLNMISIYFRTDQRNIKINLMQPISQYLIDKLAKTYYNEKEGAIILFSKNNEYSFKAAKTFYTKLSKENKDFPIPIAFAELLESDDSNQLNIAEPEILDNTPQIAYFGITENAEGFESILQFIISKSNAAHESS
ncbi:MAG: hypothetical protein ACXACU_08235 [Candidatus Hodarchaeales archaeon]|jgi:GTPase SAR1 family protein